MGQGTRDPGRLSQSTLELGTQEPGGEGLKQGLCSGTWRAHEGTRLRGGTRAR